MSRGLAAALTLLFFGGGTAVTLTSHGWHPPRHPQTLPTVTNAETQAGVPITTRRHPCRHYFYAIGADGHRHRHPCGTPTPEPDNPQPASPSPYHPASGCGVERWAVKTLTDPGASKVALGTVVASTIADLTGIAAPINPTDRLAPVETTVYQIKGTLTVAKREADGDFHLVVQDQAGATMIVEIPDPGCATGSVVYKQLVQVRTAFVAKYGTPGVYPRPELRPNVPVTVTGVGFFDRIHGQTGVAKNGAELHPVLSLSSP